MEEPALKQRSAAGAPVRLYSLLAAIGALIYKHKFLFWEK